jgi:hypothetical protein
MQRSLRPNPWSIIIWRHVVYTKVEEQVRHRIFETVKQSEADKLRLGVLYDLADSGLLN